MLAGIIVPILVAVVIFVLSISAVQMFGKQEKTGERLKRIMETQDAEVSVDKENDYFLDSLRSEKEASVIASFLAGMFKMFGVGVDKFRAKNQLRFYQAGIQSPDAIIYYLFYNRILSAIFVLIAVYVVTRSNADTIDYTLALILAVIGLFGGDMLIRNMQDKRKKKLQHSFPDSLDLLLACVESGLALDGALLRVCKELGRAHPEITQELNRTRIELSLLNDRSQALNNLADRNGLPAFRTLVTALLQSEKFGTSLTDTLRVMSEDYRTQRLMKAEEKAGRLPALITVPLIVFLLPALFLIILGPAVISILSTFK